MLTKSQLLTCTALCHEANRAYCRSLGDESQLEWSQAPEWQRLSAMEGVMFHVKNPGAGASASHDNWFKTKQAAGWHYGPVKDEQRKTHPCMVPFDELPVEQQIKDHIFRSIVHAYVSAVLIGRNDGTLTGA